MRVVHLTKYLSTYRGGIERVTDVMAAAVLDSGGEVEVVGVDPRSNRGQISSRDYPQSAIRSFGKFGPVELAPGFAQVSRWLETADIVHLHLPHPIVETALRLPHRLGRAKVVPIIHAPLSSYGTAGWLWRSCVQHSVLADADAVLTASREILANIPYYKPLLPKALVVPFPAAQVDAKYIASPSDRRAATSSDPIRLVTLGRFVAYKGYHVLLQALAQVNGHWQLDMVGGGPQQPHLEYLIEELGLQDRVKLLGNVSDEVKNELLGHADIVLVPSISDQEGYGLTIVEAFAAQRPVVTTDIPTGMAYLSRQGDCGATVPAGNVTALAEAITQLADDPDRRRRAGLNNFTFWQEQLRTEVFSERYVQGLRQLLAS